MEEAPKEEEQTQQPAEEPQTPQTPEEQPAAEAAEAVEETAAPAEEAAETVEEEAGPAEAQVPEPVQDAPAADAAAEAKADVLAGISQGDATKEKKPKAKMTAREIALAVIAVIAIIAAIVGFALYFNAQVPAGAAAKVNDLYISEEDVAQNISQDRASYGYTDDADWAYALLQQNMNPTTYRQNTINTLALNALVDQAAEEKGVSATEDQINERMDTLKQQMALGDDSVWQQTLEQYGTTEDSLRSMITTNINKSNLYETIEKPEPTDDQVLSYVQNNKAGTTLQHAYRIKFTGDDAEDRANECMDRIKVAKKQGELSTDVFSGFALSYSDDENVESDGGSYIWSDDSSITEDMSNQLTGLKEGEVSDVFSETEDDATIVEIIYCDESYTFPDSDDIADLELADLSESVQAHMKELASTSLWSSACDEYLTTLLSEADITYYPTPKDAAYNVDMTLAYSSSNASSTSTDATDATTTEETTASE